MRNHPDDIIKNKKGRPFGWEVTDEIIVTTEKLSSLGLTLEQIRDYFGISNGMWISRKKEYPELGLALKRGRSKRIAKVSGRLMEQIDAGNVPAMIFYLKTRAGWRDESLHQDNDNDENDTKITINVKDPIEAAKVYQQFMRGDKP